VNAVYVRAPLRISLGGGGTDLPSYYLRRSGFVVSAAIDRYVHIAVGTATGSRHVLRHLEHEEVDDVAAIEHPILRGRSGRTGAAGRCS
jgi:D-glycero-alpha-D-manno-heptose-7-phosphate kinase